jgi:glycosyltransferase involved in cell wall biosynthesis
MAKLSHRVLVLSPFAPASARGNAVTARRTVTRLEQSGATVRLVQADPGLVEAAIAEFKPDVLHGVHIGHTLTGLGGNPDQLPNLPIVLTFGGNDLFEDLGVAPDREHPGETKAGSVALLERASAVIVATDSQQDRAVALLGSGAAVFFAPRCPEIGFEALPHLAPLIAEARQGREPAVTIAWSGALRHQKRPEWIAPIHQALSAELPGLVTLVAGPAPRDEAERARATELANIPGIALVPPYPGGGPGIGATGTLLAATDAVLNTSRTEGKSNFILEAIARSTPVVAANTPGNRDWLANVATLFDTPEEAVAALGELLRNPTAASELAQRALATTGLERAERAESDALANAHRLALSSLGTPRSEHDPKRPTK